MKSAFIHKLLYFIKVRNRIIPQNHFFSLLKCVKIAIHFTSFLLQGKTAKIKQRTCGFIQYKKTGLSPVTGIFRYFLLICLQAPFHSSK